MKRCLHSITMGCSHFEQTRVSSVRQAYGVVCWVKNLLYSVQHIGADSGFDGICETQGACRGAVCLVKSRKKIVANDENYALAA